MKKQLAALAFAGASLAMFAGAPSAGAGHCVAPAGEASAPGYSYFGTDHVQDGTHMNGENNEGQGQHAGTSGASNCRSTDADAGISPSDRAPGKQNR